MIVTLFAAFLNAISTVRAASAVFFTPLFPVDNPYDGK
jgi:hypothetical protein